MTAATPSTSVAYELRFAPLDGGGRAVSVPCDAAGRVAIAQLSDPVLCRYAYARSAVGREYEFPFVLPRARD